MPKTTRCDFCGLQIVRIGNQWWDAALSIDCIERRVCEPDGEVWYYGHDPKGGE